MSLALQRRISDLAEQLTKLQERVAVLEKPAEPARPPSAGVMNTVRKVLGG